MRRSSLQLKKTCRTGNADESHQKLSNTGETAGPRSHMYVNQALGHAGKRKYEYQKHASILVWLNYAGEVGGVLRWGGVRWEESSSRYDARRVRARRLAR